MKGGEIVKKSLSNGAVAGILIVFGIIVVIVGWKVLAGPSAPPPAQITKEMMSAHNASAAEIRADQQRRAAAAVSGGSH